MPSTTDRTLRLVPVMVLGGWLVASSRAHADELSIGVVAYRDVATTAVATGEGAVGTAVGDVRARIGVALDEPEQRWHTLAAAWRVPLGRAVAVTAELGRYVEPRFVVVDEPATIGSLALAYTWQHDTSAVELAAQVDTQSALASVVAARAQVLAPLAVEAHVAIAYVVGDRHPAQEAGLRAVVSIGPALDVGAWGVVRAIDPSSYVIGIAATVRRLP